ncbi:MAG: TonB family protein, partial [Calditrichia bacterium]|nr:TonB family protein [Calditrichia bacterium]
TLDPENSEAKNKIKEMEDDYLAKGARALQRKRNKSAKVYFEKVLEINPDNVTAISSVSMLNIMLDEQQRNRNAEKARQKQEALKIQKNLKQQKLEQQKKEAADQKRRENEKRQEEAKNNEAAKALDAANKVKNTVFIEGLVDGGRRIYVKRVTPELSVSAKRTGATGTVFIEVIVGNDGLPLETKIQKSDSEILGQAALDAVKQYKYKPPTKNGSPCKMKLTEVIRFR